MSNVQDMGARRLFAITKSDTVNLPGPCRAIWVGTAGDVAVICENDTAAVTMKNCLSGSVLPVRATRVMSTNTTATDMVALY